MGENSKNGENEEWANCLHKHGKLRVVENRKYNGNNFCVKRMCMNCVSSVLVVQVVLHTRPRIITI